MKSLFEPLAFARGPVMKNRFMLAPLTNLQSHADGSLSDEEFHWLTMRARGGFGLVSTCAAHVQAIGQGFAGQLGVFADHHVRGLSRLAEEIRRHDCLAFAQLHHAGLRSPEALIGTRPVSAFDDEKSGARALSTAEVEQLAADFVAAAQRAEQAGFDGVQLHGAHGYLIAQFLDGRRNQRGDRYGGSLENRARLIFEILREIRAQCRPDFLLSVRLSPDRFGMTVAETPTLAQWLLESGLLDLLELSMWDVFREAEEEAYRGCSLLSYFSGLPRGDVCLAAAGKLYGAPQVQRAVDAGLDVVSIGRAGILHHDFPERCRRDAEFQMHGLPVTEEYLHREGLSDAFIGYMRNWEGFVAS